MVSLPGAKSRYNAGDQTGDFIAKVADGVANFACGLYKDFPGAVVDQSNPLTRDFGTGLMDSLCGSRQPGLPVSPNPTFAGGQCQTTYTVVTRRVTPSTTGNPPTISGGTSTVPGKLNGLQMVGLADSGTKKTWVLSYVTNAGVVDTIPVGTYGLSTEVSIQSVVRADGLPDNCGNKEPGFPPSSIPPERTSGNVTINKNDGTNITIPVVYAPIQPTLNVTPRFDFNLGGINVTFDAGGFTFSNDNEPGDPINRDNGTGQLGDAITNLGDNITNLGDNVTNLGDTVNNINRDVSDIKDAQCECLDDVPNNTLPDPKTEDDPKEESGSDDIESIEITLTSVPRNSRRQSGDGSPDVIYAGWFEWRRGEFSFPREPIHFEQSIFKNLVGADGFAYTVYKGVRAKHTVNRKADEP